MSFERASEYLKSFGLGNNIKTFNEKSATVAEAARLLRCREEEIGKTLSFRVGDGVILLVTSGDQKIDNPKYKTDFGCKAQMLPREEVESLIGHEVGGVCPFGINEDIRVYLDVSLKRFDVVYLACGRDCSTVEMSLEELEKTTKYPKWIDVCKSCV